jgi:predicted porin
MAQIDVTVGGHTKNYLGWLDQDDSTAATDARSFDMLRESELHFNAEGTSDNGLTYGFHVEAEADGDDSFDVEESYLYLASNLGRVNLGSEDGAAYLLQVAAPSGDANIDGLRQYINPFTDIASIDYDNDATGTSEKITYLSPNWNGLQVGASYTPSIDGGVDDFDLTSPTVGADIASAFGGSDALSGFALDDDDDFVEAAIRYEGTFNNIGFALGGGYGENAGDNDYEQWNLGADFDIGAFGVGAAYTEEETDDAEAETIVVGADYTTGPFQLGVSYLNLDGDDDSSDADRFAGGVVYTVTQGLTLRGSVQYVDADDDGGAGDDDDDATAVLGGIQFNF